MLSGLVSTETFAITIPLLAIMGGIAIAIVSILAGGRGKELQHKERIVAMEKGIPVPEEPKRKKREGYLRNRTGGLVMTGIGLALTIALFTVAGKVGGVWGLIPLSIGLGLLVSATMERKEVGGNGGTPPGEA